MLIHERGYSAAISLEKLSGSLTTTTKPGLLEMAYQARCPREVVHLLLSLRSSAGIFQLAYGRLECVHQDTDILTHGPVSWRCPQLRSTHWIHFPKEDFKRPGYNIAGVHTRFIGHLGGTSGARKADRT